MSDNEYTDLGLDEGGPTIPPLVTMGDARLGGVSAPVAGDAIGGTQFTERLETLARAMVAYHGIGIAAPQIGWFERFFAMTRFGAGEDGEMRAILEYWINPEIVAVSDEQNWAWEGCLSVPGLRGWIRRPAAVAVRGLNGAGQSISREYTGWDARVFQHEFDHLDGMLFPYRAAHPSHVMMLEHLEHRDDWPEDWPAPGARETMLGALWDGD